MIKVSDYIMKRLRDEYGVGCVFMVTGGGAMHLNDSVGRYLPYVCNHHEQACAIAAEGYARVHQKLGVVQVTTGPGGLNCLNGVMGQWTDSVSVLYISGQVKYATTLASCGPDAKLRQLGDQEVDIISVVRPLTKYAALVTDPKRVKYHLDRAIHLATHGRFGPVWLDIPLDVQAARVDEAELVAYDPREDEVALPPLDGKVAELKEKLRRARRPLLVAGHGIRLAGAEEAFLRLVDRLGVPVVTTMNGFDLIPSAHPCFIGRIGTVANRAGNFVLQNADLVITVGSRNNIRQVSYNWENYVKNGALVCVDIDAAELEKPTIGGRIALKIHGDCGAFIRAFADAEAGDIGDWWAYCRRVRDRFDFVREAARVAPNPIEPYAFISAMIDQAFSEGEVVVCGNGTAFLVPFQVGKVKARQRFIWNSGDASMGYDLPAAIGACLAHGRKRTICLAGDGSIMMNLQELQTIRNYNLPIKIFIFNNDGYISIQQTQRNFFDGRLTGCTRETGVRLPDFLKVGAAFDLPVVRVADPATALDEVRRVLALEGPVLCEVMCSPGYIFAPKLSARRLEDGTMVSPSLEDLYPFLSRAEYEENMRRP